MSRSKKSFVVYFHTSQNSFFSKKLRERTRENPLFVRGLAFSFGKQGGIMDYKANIPIYLQVIDDIKKRILTGEIKLGDKLP